MTLFVILLIALTNPIFSQESWKKEVDRKGVQVYTRIVEGYPIKAFKATSIVNASPKQIMDILSDIENYSEWVANCRATTILSGENETPQYFHMEIEAPFPAEDRDLVQSSEIKIIDSLTTQLVITNHPEFIAPKQGMVRMPKSDGNWTLTWISDSTTFVQLEMQNDPGGKVPNWLVNSLITGSPFKTMSNLRNKFVE